MTKEGTERDLFEGIGGVVEVEEPKKIEFLGDSLGDEFLKAKNNREDIATIWRLELDVDDTNEPIPENILPEDAPIAKDSGLYDGQIWGWDGDCNRVKKKTIKEIPAFCRFKLDTINYFSIFIYFLHLAYINDDVIPMTSVELTKGVFKSWILESSFFFLGFG